MTVLVSRRIFDFGGQVLPLVNRPSVLHVICCLCSLWWGLYNDWLLQAWLVCALPATSCPYIYSLVLFDCSQTRFFVLGLCSGLLLYTLLSVVLLVRTVLDLFFAMFGSHVLLVHCFFIVVPSSALKMAFVFCTSIACSADLRLCRC